MGVGLIEINSLSRWCPDQVVWGSMLSVLPRGGVGEEVVVVGVGCGVVVGIVGIWYSNAFFCQYKTDGDWPRAWDNAWSRKPLMLEQPLSINPAIQG